MLFDWKKVKLLEAMESQAWLYSSLDEQTVSCYTEEKGVMQELNAMKKILFVCHGNICRSPMAELVMKDLVKKTGLASQFHIESAATSQEEIGNPVYPPARRKLAEYGISCNGHAARQLTNADYEKYDLLIGMDRANFRDMYRICGGDFAGRLHLLMDYTDHPRDVADPWYTEDFEATWQDVLAGCQGLLKEFMWVFAVRMLPSFSIRRCMADSIRTSPLSLDTKLAVLLSPKGRTSSIWR